MVNKNNENKKQLWKIPVFWTSWGVMEIEASSQEEAFELALGAAALPSEFDTHYIEGSCKIDHDGLDDYRPEEIE